MSAAPQKKTHPYRRQLLGKIHIAKKTLGLDDDTYRDVLEAKTGKRSAKMCSNAQLVDMVEHFKAQGFKPKSKKAPARAGSRPLAGGEQQAKMRALWITLYHLAVVRDPSEQALANFAKRMTKVAALQWLGPDDCNIVIEALKAIASRDAGVDWTEAIVPLEIFDERRRVIIAQMVILMAVAPPHYEPPFRWQEVTYLGTQILSLTEDEADQAIEYLGGDIRQALRARDFETLKDWRKAERKNDGHGNLVRRGDIDA